MCQLLVPTIWGFISCAIQQSAMHGYWLGGAGCEGVSLQRCGCRCQHCSYGCQGKEPHTQLCVLGRHLVAPASMCIPAAIYTLRPPIDSIAVQVITYGQRTGMLRYRI